MREKTRPEIEVIQCPSGFWAVMVGGEMYDAASRDLETANKKADDLRADRARSCGAKNFFKCTQKSVDKRTSSGVE